MDIGRRSVPPRIVATVMTLQKLEGLSDREAVERLRFDLRWKYAAGGLDIDYPGFVHTVLVDMRARLRESERPNRIFEAVLDVAKAAGLVGRKRVLDSTPLYDAVATQDTVTMIRSAIRGLLREAPAALEEQLRSLLKRDAAYGTAENLKALEASGIESNFKVQGPGRRKGKFSKDDFAIDLDANTVTCKNGECVELRADQAGGGRAHFGSACDACPLRADCTDAKVGRTVEIHPDERLLTQERARQKAPGWLDAYRATRPKVERKIGHLMFRRHGGRRARMRGRTRIGQDFSLLAAAINIKRLAALAVALTQPTGCPA